MERAQRPQAIDDAGSSPSRQDIGAEPSDSAAKSVPSVPSVACSTAEALAWDASFKNQNDPSGRAVAGVHEKAYK